MGWGASSSASALVLATPPSIAGADTAVIPSKLLFPAGLDHAAVGAGFKKVDPDALVLLWPFGVVEMCSLHSLKFEPACFWRPRAKICDTSRRLLCVYA